ncbi:hypothetical protein [Parasphingorhabdus sp.]
MNIMMTTSTETLTHSSEFIRKQRDHLQRTKPARKWFAVEFVSGYNQASVAHYSPPNWNSLMTEAHAGSQSAYRRLLVEFEIWLDGYLSAESSNQMRADLISEILYTVHKKRSSCDSSRPVLLWLLAIAEHRIERPISSLRTN